MRLRARRPLSPEATGLELTVPELLESSGPEKDRWAAVFGRDAPLCLEIGVGKDPHIISRARLDAAGSFVGLEYSRKKIDMVLSKAAREHVKNLRVMRADATRVLAALFPPTSLAAVWILFPDPWPKKRHRKKRLVNAEFMALLASRMRPGALLEVRTDDADYKDQVSDVLAAIPLLENLLAGRAYASEPCDFAGVGGKFHIATIFEEKFQKAGRAIHYFYFRRRHDDRDSPAQDMTISHP